jgi:hypothetical protein
MVAGVATLEVGHYYSVENDCLSDGYATLRVTKAPKHGTVTMSQGTAFPSYPPNNPRSTCNKRRVDSMLVNYSPESGFVGTDAFSLDIIYASGGERMDDYQITVK